MANDKRDWAIERNSAGEIIRRRLDEAIWIERVERQDQPASNVLYIDSVATEYSTDAGFKLNKLRELGEEAYAKKASSTLAAVIAAAGNSDKLFFCVKSAFYADWTITAEIVKAEEHNTKPPNTLDLSTSADIYYTWFPSVTAANEYVDGCIKASIENLDCGVVRKRRKKKK